MPSQAFPYRKHASGLYPTVPVELSHLSKTINVDGLIDSGSNYCVFQAEIGEAIGLPIERGEKITLTTVSDEIPLYLYTIEMKVQGFEKTFSCKAGFARRMKTSFNLLGRTGFFENYKIAFDEKQKTVELTEY